MLDEIKKHFEHVPPKMLKKLLSGFIWEGTPDSGKMALTFDDGPDSDVTPPVLEILEKEGIRGTFFLLGEKVKQHPDIAREIAGRGHLIGSHTMTHRKLFLVRKEEVEREIDEAQKIIGDITGVCPEYFRPPHGIFDYTSADVVKKKELSIVLWTVLSGDYSDDPPERIIKTVEPFVRPGSIVVFHDTTRGGGAQLPGMIEEIGALARERNVGFGGIDELSISSDITMDEPDSD